MCTSTTCSRCDFASGDIIDGKFTIDKMLGEGSYGRVYKVRHGQKHYALKLFKFWEILSSERTELTKRFDREFETGRIQSSHLVHSLEKGIVQGNPYIVMEFCSGGDLLSYASSASKINYSKVASEILFGLRDLHNNGKIHRDLKPENILVKENGTVVITDFGITGDQNNRLTMRGQIMGTPVYMAPEQRNPPRFKKPYVLPTVDIFSFGVLMYELLTGSLPFGPINSNDQYAVYVANAKKGSWDRQLLQQKKPDWMPLIEGCLRPDLNARLQSIEDVLKLVPNAAKSSGSFDSSNAAHQRQQMANGIILRIKQGEEYGIGYKIANVVNGTPRILTMGRKDDDVLNHIPITENDSSYISRRHCTLEYDVDKKRWLIRDGQYRMRCGIAEKTFKDPFPCRSCSAQCHPNPGGQWQRSLNGTYINSKEVDEKGCYFSLGDIITIGEVKLKVEGF